MDDNVNEVTLIEQDLLMTVDDFARQERVSPRTVYRWIEMGRLDTVERLGKKYVNASIPLKTALGDNDNVGNVTKSEDDTQTKTGGALQNINIFEEYIKTLRENGKRYERSCRRWQMACFASVFLLIIALLAGTAIGLTYHYGTENLSGRLEASSAELAQIESDKSEALAKIDKINDQVQLQLKPYKEQNVKLQKRIDDLTARNDDLRDRLDEIFERNAILLQRIAEGSTIDGVAAAGPLEKTGDTSR